MTSALLISPCRGSSLRECSLPARARSARSETEPRREKRTNQANLLESSESDVVRYALIVIWRDFDSY